MRFGQLVEGSIQGTEAHSNQFPGRNQVGINRGAAVGIERSKHPGGRFVLAQYALRVGEIEVLPSDRWPYPSMKLRYSRQSPIRRFFAAFGWHIRHRVNFMNYNFKKTCYFEVYVQ